MGLDVNGLRFLLSCRKNGVDFGRSAMIGRQCLVASVGELKTLEGVFHAQLGHPVLTDGSLRFRGYTEPLFTALGAEEVHSYDASEYEGATRIHDLNVPIPEEFKKSSSMVLDGGSLEHVFNFPVAIRNCMEMVEVGGHYLGITPTNNFSGHGFYQFSPELYFNVFSGRNGYRMRALICFEEGDDQWYQVANPLDVGRRVSLTNALPAYLLVVAQRMEFVEIFREIPQQTDYSALWQSKKASEGEQVHPNDRERGILGPLRKFLPSRLRRNLKALRNTAGGSFDPALFRKIDELKF